jgi:hypothetical protein
LEALEKSIVERAGAEATQNLHKVPMCHSLSLLGGVWFE